LKNSKIKMVVPSRRSKMIQNFMKIQEKEKNESTKKIESKKINSEEHKERIEMLKKLGLIKKD
tara:strand:+ start:1097 stop:1285 length:189 start_codon:yes stop_codon:yes gene_type:complete